MKQNSCAAMGWAGLAGAGFALAPELAWSLRMPGLNGSRNPGKSDGVLPDRRDIIWIDCNPQVGREMKDLHPMLVLSPKPFNERTSIVIGLPMTTAKFNDTNPSTGAIFNLT